MAARIPLYAPASYPPPSSNRFVSWIPHAVTGGTMTPPKCAEPIRLRAVVLPGDPG